MVMAEGLTLLAQRLGGIGILQGVRLRGAATGEQRQREEGERRAKPRAAAATP